MSDVPLRCVVDTNVATTANGANSSAGAQCVAASARALHSVMNSGHVFIDQGGEIVKEYRRNLKAKGQPGPGDLFFLWLLTNEWGVGKVTRVDITPRPDDPSNYQELPDPPAGTTYDPSDRKFLAVAASHPDRPPILQAFDAKWWGWQDALSKVGVSIHFLCPREIAKKHRQKHER